MRLISNELKSIIDSSSQQGTSVNINVYGGTTGYNRPVNVGQINNINGGVKDLLVTYFKRRAVAVIFMVIVLMLLVTTSLFTDMGLNIGQVIFNAVSNFLGY